MEKASGQRHKAAGLGGWGGPGECGTVDSQCPSAPSSAMVLLRDTCKEDFFSWLHPVPAKAKGDW